jgi:hypothetical protein
MFLALHTCFELYSLDYEAIIIEFMNCLPPKFNGDILFELLLIRHPLGHFGQLQGMDIKYDGHVLAHSQLLEGLKCESQTENNRKMKSHCTLPGS